MNALLPKGTPVREGRPAVRPAWRRALWGVLALVACLTLGPDFVRGLRPPPTLILDFFQEWASARNVLEGRPVYADQEETCRAYLGYQRQPSDRAFLEVNGHPPTSVLLALPLAGLSYSDAFLVWDLLSLAALAASLGIVVRQLRLPVAVWMVLPALPLLLLCSPLRQHLLQGQLNLLLLLLLTGTWAADRSDRPLTAGCLLGAATAIKLFPGFVLVYFLARRRYRAAAAALVSVLVLTLLTLLLLGPQAYVDYVRKALPHVGEFRSSWLNASLHGFWSRLLDVGSRGANVRPLAHQPWLAWAATLGCAAVVVVALLRALRRAATRAAADQAFGTTVTAMLLLSPVTWDHYAVLLVLPVVLLARGLPRGGLARRVLLLATAVLGLSPMLLWWVFLGVTFRTWQDHVASPWQSVTVLSLSCYALVTLFVLGLRAATRSPAHLGSPGCQRGQTACISDFTQAVREVPDAEPPKDGSARLTPRLPVP